MISTQANILEENSVYLSPLAFKLIRAPHGVLGLQAYWLNQSFLDFSLFRNTPNNVAIITGALDTIVSKVLQATAEALQYTPAIMGNAVDTLRLVLDTVVTEVVADNPTMIEYFKTCANMVVAPNYPIPYKANWGAEYNVPTVDPVQYKVHPTSKYALGDVVNLDCGFSTVRPRTAAVLGYANIGSEKPNYPESLIVVSTNTSSHSNYLDYTGDSLVSGLLATKVDNVRYLLPKPLSRFQSTQPSITDNEHLDIKIRSLVGMNVKTPEYLEKLRDILTHSILSKPCLGCDTYANDFQRSLILFLKHHIRQLLCLAELSEHKGRERPDYVYPLNYEYLLNCVTQLTWVHHTSDQFYKILGFIGGDSITVVYYNTQNYNMYTRPVDDWYRSFVVGTSFSREELI